MMNSNTKKPVVLVIAGHDPSGGAGIQADIESIVSCECYAATVITSLTTQNTKTVSEIIPQSVSSFEKQIQLILEDMNIAACKIGMIGNIDLLDVVKRQLSNINVPIVFDPVLSATSGQSFLNENTYPKIFDFLPVTTVITPNAKELRSLTGISNIDAAANHLLKLGANSILVTGTDEATENVINRYYVQNEKVVEYQWERLQGLFHGSGCTLSSRISALLALGEETKTSIEKAQAYTWNTLKHALNLGQHQLIPNRFYD